MRSRTRREVTEALWCCARRRFGESEGLLKKVFEAAEALGGAIIFIVRGCARRCAARAAGVLRVRRTALEAGCRERWGRKG